MAESKNPLKSSVIQRCRHWKIRMNHDFVGNFRKKLHNLKISDYHGLKSPGLTCYLNSVLQVFFMTEDFREAVKGCCSHDSTTIEAHLAKLFSDLERKKAETSGITEKLGITNVWEQRDAAEYFEKILCLTCPEASKVFKGELNHWTKCLKCKQRNDSRDLFWILPLAVEDSGRQIYSVEKGLEAFFRGERVSGDNKIYCNHCNDKHNAEFGCEMTQHPEILTLLLKRFSFDNKHRCYVKLHCEVEVPKTLHMKNCTYDLYALVHHCGDLTGGHYTSHIKSFQTQGWYHFNDDVVKGVRQSLFGEGGRCLRSFTAYLLMYRKAPAPPFMNVQWYTPDLVKYKRVEPEGEKTVSKGPEESDSDGACSTNFDVGAERRHDKPEQEETLIPHDQLEDECCREESSKHFSEGFLDQNHHDVGLKTQRRLFNTPENHYQESACFWRTEGSIQDGGQKRQTLESNTTDHLQCFNTRGSPKPHLETRLENSMLKEWETKRLPENKTDWETQKSTVSKTEMTRRGTDGGLTRKRVKTTVDNSVRAAVRETTVERSLRNATKNKVKEEPWR